ncbi:hypothetical protein [Nonomuraea pusilla]|uniref:Uncharacterized protein n=1 Tax=Nonomuraea pusilla TaxID=46177 RepID=A0A1H8KAY3_9ACTN|nr:hypothetical protein [Nonomuraea pusilla]SEN89588.1 hypothetical protein SAMN05660976_08555 [Nonomuraea pusilla]
MICRFLRWLSEPVERPFTPGFTILAATLATASAAASFWFAWYALETGNEHVLLVVLAFLALALWDLFRRLRKSR